MRSGLIACIALVAAVGGCKSPDDEAAKPGPMANPSGVPQNEQQANQASLQQQAGENAKKQMAEAAQAMKEAQQRPGSK